MNNGSSWGSGVAISAYSGGSIGFDGLFIIKPDGRITFQSGIGNHGTHSVIDVHRVAAEIIGVPWEQCEVVWGNTSKHLPWTCASGGSQTTHAMPRAAHDRDLVWSRQLTRGERIGAHVFAERAVRFERADAAAQLALQIERDERRTPLAQPRRAFVRDRKSVV